MTQQAVDLFLDEIFSVAPVIRPDVYIASAVAQARRTLHHHEARTMPPPAYELETWLRPELLGPYETTLLATLLYSPGPVIVLRGGAGSGKSSVLGYLGRHVYECAAALPPGTLGLGYRTFIAQVDVQTLVPPLDFQSTEEPPIDSLLSHIAESLSTVAQSLEEADVKRVLAGVMNDRPTREPVSIRHNVSAALFRDCKPDSKHWQEASPAECLRLFGEAAAKLHADDHLVAWLAVFRTVHRELNGGDTRGNTWPVVLVLDNVDPLNAVQQSRLLRTLNRVTSGPEWGNSRIVLAARLSTFEQHISTLGFHYYDHDAADPADVVLVRTALAIFAPEAYGSFASASVAAKNHIYDALYELFAHLVDRGYFFDLLSAMSGTSIRNALGLAHDWCLSARINTLTQESWRKDEFQRQLRTALCKNYLQELAQRIGRQAQMVVHDLLARFDPQRVSVTLFSKELSDAITRVIHSAEPCRTFADGDRSPRAILGRKLQEGLLEALRTQAKDDPHGTLLCTVCSLMESASTLGMPADTVSEVAAKVASEFDGEPGDQPVVDALRGWVSSAITSCVSSRVKLREMERLRRAASFEHQGLHADAESSRFSAQMRLLSSSGPAGANVARALNAFALDEERICPVILRILYTLRYRGNADTTRANLIRSLKRHNYSDDEICTGLKAVLALPRRMVFSGIDDHFQGIDDWIASGDKIVKLSSAGVGYLDVLLHVPSYLQWCFQIRAVRNATGRPLELGSVRGRLTTALLGFELAIADEMARLDYAWKNAGSGTKPQVLRTTELTVQSASADVFFRSLDAFMSVYRLNISIRPSDAHPLANDAADWVELGKKTRTQLNTFFQTGNHTWNTIISDAEREVSLMRPARGGERALSRR